MTDINIKDVAKYYAELPHQNKGLEILQNALEKAGLTDENEEWVQEFRKAEKPSVKLELPVSVAAKESQVLQFTGIVDWNNPRSRVCKYFTVQDVTQGDSRRRPQKGSNAEKNILLLAKELDKIRNAWGHPIGCSSWYRPEPINSQVGGVRGSKHTTGVAADVYPMAGGDIWKFQIWLDSVWFGRLGYGAKKGFVHVDIANGKGFMSGGAKGVRWNY